MKVMVDLNVLLDVIQKRDPHYVSSVQVVDAVAINFIEGTVSAHTITTLHCIISKQIGIGNRRFGRRSSCIPSDNVLDAAVADTCKSKQGFLMFSVV